MNLTVKHLFIKYINQQCTSIELEKVFSLLAKGTHQAEWEAAIAEDAALITSTLKQSELTDTDLNRIYSGITSALVKSQKQATGKSSVPAPGLWPQIAIAAAAVASIVFGIWFYSSRPAVNRNAEIVSQNDIGPGKQGATLTLANGKKIKLNNEAQGELAKETGVSISKSADGQLHYTILNRDNDEKSSENQINTLATAKGETYMVILPDHSKVWLNALSSLTYSATLNRHGIRRVSLEGEAYFEVAKDKEHPFVVKTDKQEVEVLGTHFNINSYKDEPVVKTTLLEGSVKVITANRSLVIRPGQQAQVSNSAIGISAADANDAVAWKSGIFNFEKSDIQTVMRQLSRWYDVDVIYEGAVPKTMITGKVYRNASLSKAMEILTYLDIHYNVKGRTITITP